MFVQQVAAVTLFCEDARDEVAGGVSLIGVMPDNLRLVQVPSNLAKLVMYTRIIIPRSYHGAISLVLQLPDGREVMNVAVEKEVIEKSRVETADDISISGLILRASSVNFPIEMEGRISLLVRTDEGDLLSGFLVVKQDSSGKLPPPA